MPAVDRSALERLLESVRAGETDVHDAARRLAGVLPRVEGPAAPVASEVARLDHHRAMRCGFPEVVLGQGKRTDDLVRIDDGSLIGGTLPKTAARLVEQWRQLHVDELSANWAAAQEPSALSGIEPLQ